ncbi:MAG: DUF3445 domain-containing protein [Halioglobus sp.]
MIYDNTYPRYLPHLEHPEVLVMGLNPMQAESWIEQDNSLPSYIQHKRTMRSLHGARVYQADQTSLPAQLELSKMLRAHLLESDGREHLDGKESGSVPTEVPPAADSPEVLWETSLWIADDLVLMEQRGDEYYLTAASLCSPSHWHLEEKFGRPMREIHDPIPGFHRELTPRIDRFFKHLQPSHPVVRFNWSVQAGYNLAQFPDSEPPVDEHTDLYYRCERQSLVRLPVTGAIAFTIRVYLHPLETLSRVPGAMTAMLKAIDGTPTALAQYKGFDQLASALGKYRAINSPEPPA